ncbi:hypothetical protein [Paraburkholderia fungorum]|uniref:NADH:quinone oxidoreductase/Mrp antiporter membrane subunit domain-containing protein n=1 Tax=Paraburkholderia fungorum TaxID=134537 RepID=A0AAW3V2Q8_9BURK|nr:hypothetical protein [Paraburkholderia fungorum]MBB4517148.1 hypothetical protein [Paraburkholderia fungorum]MBB6204216.1 hypothetical protein [Paraburkholderia fungorum]
MFEIPHIAPDQFERWAILCVSLGVIGFPPLFGFLRPQSALGWAVVCAAALGSLLLSFLLVANIAQDFLSSW